MTLCNLIPLWFSSYGNSSFLCTLINMKTSVGCKMAKNMFGNCWECLSAGGKAHHMHNVYICVCVCVCVCVCSILFFEI